MNYKISVVIPLFINNNEASLSHFEDLILSIKKNLKNIDNHPIHELIIVDDNPFITDRIRVKSILSQIEKFCSVNYIQNEKNEGQSVSRNVGAFYARGNYLHFIDQDDLLDSKFYFNLLSQKSGCDFILGDCVNLNDKKTSFYRKITKNILHKATSLNNLKFLLFNNISNSPGQFIIKRELFNEVNGFPELNNRGSDDFAVFLRLLQKPHLFRYVDDAKFFYRIHQGQSSRILNMKASEIEAFHNLKFRLFDIMFWVKIVKLNIFFSFMRIILYRIFFNTLK